MEENKNQGQTGFSGASDGILVKDVDGRFKITSEGGLRELDAFLSDVQASQKTEPTPVPGEAQGLGFPKFTDLAITPQDSHFKQLTGGARESETSQLHFHPEDRRELERELEKINTLFSLAPQKKYSIEKIAARLAEKHSLRLQEHESESFTRLMLSYFRQARNAIQVKNALMSAKDQGGLGLASETADHVLTIAKHLKQKIEETDGIVVEERNEVSEAARSDEKPQSMPVLSTQREPVQRPVPVQPMRPLVPQFQPEAPKPNTTIEQKRPVEVPFAAAPPVAKPFFVDEVSPSSAGTGAPVPQPLPQPQEAAPRPQSRPTMPIQPLRPSEIPKMARPAMPPKTPLMVDVRRIEPKLPAGALTGRVEELAMMDLATWRLLDADPRIRAGKILGKIQNLEHESLTRKSQGVQAWRSNEVYQHYLMLGEQSLHQRKNVVDIIKDFESRGMPTLGLDEFEAITDLNRTLRF